MKLRLTIIKKLLILFVCLIGCKTISHISQDQLLGKYQWHGLYGIASNISLNQDSSFVYHWQQGLISGTTKGKWDLEGENIILNSQYQPEETEKYEIDSFNHSKTGAYKIRVKDEKNYSLPFVACVLMKDSTVIDGAETNENGICELKISNQANAIEISGVGYFTVKLPIYKLKGNEFSITMYEGSKYYQYFTNRKWKVTYKRLIDPEIKIDKYTKRNYYEKVE